jgi:hypothetical protein
MIGQLFIEGFLDSKDGLYKFYDLPRPDPGPTSFIAHTDEREENLA